MPLRAITIGAADYPWHEAFFRFLARVFPGADFRPWHGYGGWTDSYHAHALVEGSELIANVSVNHMDLCAEGRPLRGAQLGAVGVVPGCRGRGFARRLMAEVLGRLEPELVFLFAHDGVRHFYPRLGFVRVEQHRFGVERALAPASTRLPRLCFAERADRELLGRLARAALPVTERWGARDYGTTLLWYATNDHGNDFYYAREHDAVIVAQQEGPVLTVLDVIAPSRFELAELLPRLAHAPIERIEFAFTPELFWPSAGVLGSVAGSSLFVLPGWSLPPSPFRFPELAHT